LNHPQCNAHHSCSSSERDTCSKESDSENTSSWRFVLSSRVNLWERCSPEYLDQTLSEIELRAFKPWPSCSWYLFLPSPSMSHEDTSAIVDMNVILGGLEAGSFVSIALFGVLCVQVHSYYSRPRTDSRLKRSTVRDVFLHCHIDPCHNSLPGLLRLVKFPRTLYQGTLLNFDYLGFSSWFTLALYAKGCTQSA
jgi:hypothetical protein